MWTYADPIHIAHTGDGAMVVFAEFNENNPEEKPQCQWEGKSRQNSCLFSNWNPHECNFIPEKHRRHRTISNVTILKAFSFLFALNAMVQQENYGEKFTVVEATLNKYQYLPLYLRFALSIGRVFPVINCYNDLECIGSPTVTANRILSTDHENHFLIDRKLLKLINMVTFTESGKGQSSFSGISH